MQLSRRDFLRLSASVSAVLLSGRGYSQPLRRRKEISTLTPTELASYRSGVSAMKVLARDNPLSWDYQRAVHRIDPGGSTLNVLSDPTGVASYWRQCKHGHDHFFSWHRWEMLYWEEMCRQLSGDTNFNLPYWDWMANGFLPDALRQPSAGPANPLYHATRNSTFNDGSSQLNDLGQALALNGFSSTAFLEFSGRFEGNPHGQVHVAIGGDMRDPDTAALDPIFYLHHANIDRYWVEWLRQGGGRANPAGAWLTETFNFQTIAGPKTPTAGGAVTTEGLGYTYDRERIVVPRVDFLKFLRGLRLPYKLPKPKVIPVPRPPRPGPDPAPWTTLGIVGAFQVDGFPTIVQVPRDPASVMTLRRALTSRDVQVAFEFHGIRIEPAAKKEGFIYQIFLVSSEKNLVADRTTEVAEIGSLTSFNVLAAMGHKHQGHDADPPPRVVMSDEAKSLLAKVTDRDPAIVLVRRSPLKDKTGKERAFNPKELMFSVEQLHIAARKS